MSELTASPAVFNLKLNNRGLKAFELNGIDYYTDKYYVYRGAEGGDAKSDAAETGDEAEAQPVPETTETQKKKIDIPLGGCPRTRFFTKLDF